MFKELSPDVQDHLRLVAGLWLTTVLFASGEGLSNAFFSSAERSIVSLLSVTLFLVWLYFALLVLWNGLCFGLSQTSIQKKISTTLIAPCAITISVISGMIFWKTTSYAGYSVFVSLNEPKFSAVRAEIAAGRYEKSSSVQDILGIPAIIDAGPPVRIAFWPKGVFELEAIVYDPTGRALEWASINDYNARTGNKKEAKRLFGAEIRHCTNLTKSYYNCYLH